MGNESRRATRTRWGDPLPRAWTGVVAALLALATYSCSAEPSVPGLPCDTHDDCSAGKVCLDGTCRLATGDAGRCPADRACGASCCAEGEVCRADGTCAAECVNDRAACGSGASSTCCGAHEACMDGRCVDCGGGTRCGEVCCSAEQMCLEGTCVAECADPDKLCGEARDMCCGDGQACLNDACVPLGDECERTEECPVDELCEPTLGRCVPRSDLDVCEFRPPVGEFSPTVGCHWEPPPDGPFASFDDVVMTPSVANLTDDNGDGRTDTRDIPDIAFVSFSRPADGCCTHRGVLRVVSGACNDDGSMETLATLNPGAGGSDPWIGNSTGIALGNLDPDDQPDEHPPEIVATFKGGGVIAYKRATDDGSRWKVFWRTDDYITGNHGAGPRYRDPQGAQPQLVDLDGNGAPEVVIGNVALNGQTGELFWDGLETGTSERPGRGNNAFLGPNATVADVDLDGTPEVIAGNTAYDGETGAEEWTYEYTGNHSTCHKWSDATHCDGFNAVANFDDDETSEIVIVRLGEVFVLEHDGTLKTQMAIPWDDCTKRGSQPANEGGPPTVADFDGDGNTEIGVASADFYVVFDLDCTGDPLPEACDSEQVLWKKSNEDCTSRVTGSSVFDFEGDGKAEVVYADESSFRIFDGTTGDILYEDASHDSNTRMEMPVVVDVDNDGKSEVVVPEPNEAGDAVDGIQIWEDQDNNWVRTRRIWNQHAYHVTNITEDGQVPREEEPNWQNGRLNNFRQNVQPAGLFDAPDLVVQSVVLDTCLGSGDARIAVTVANEGALGVPPGVFVHATAEIQDGMTYDLGVQETGTRLLPGTSETVYFEWSPPDGWDTGSFTVTATVDEGPRGRGAYNECEEGNNEGMSEPLRMCGLR